MRSAHNRKFCFRMAGRRQQQEGAAGVRQSVEEDAELALRESTASAVFFAHGQGGRVHEHFGCVGG